MSNSRLIKALNGYSYSQGGLNKEQLALIINDNGIDSRGMPRHKMENEIRVLLTNQSGGAGPGNNIFKDLVRKAKGMGGVKGADHNMNDGSGVVSSGYKKTKIVPESKYHLIPSNSAPNPEQHSWYHHHSPFSQNFGDYVCLKRSTLKELGVFMKDALFSDVSQAKK